jgi:hypothetical protein
MDAQTRLQIVNTYQQQLRDDAVVERLARAGRSALRPSDPGTWFPRTIGAMRRLVGPAA